MQSPETMQETFMSDSEDELGKFMLIQHNNTVAAAATTATTATTAFNPLLCAHVLFVAVEFSDCVVCHPRYSFLIVSLVVFVFVVLFESKHSCG